MARDEQAPALPDYLRPYAEAVETCGTAFEALLIRDRSWQEARFAAFARTVDLRGRALADLGSGRADLPAWLAGHGFAWRRYVGVEAIPELDRFARQRCAREGLAADLLLADFVCDAGLFARIVDAYALDLLLFCGSLNTLAEDEALRVLDRAWAALDGRPGAALGFNFLAGGDAWPRPSTRLPRRDTRAWFRWACDRTPLLGFCQGYLGAHDATIVMVRPG